MVDFSAVWPIAYLTASIIFWLIYLQQYCLKMDAENARIKRNNVQKVFISSRLGHL